MDSNIPATITRPWTIFCPPVYRYLKPEHVDAFFDSGRLRLSSFALFSQHHDDERQDGQEGVNHLYFQNKGAQFGIGTVMSHGNDAYVLCSCMQLEPERMSRWGGSYIKIENMMEFAAAVSAHIPGFKGGLEGPCTYRDHRMITGDSGKLTHSDFATEGRPGTTDLQKMITATESMAGPSVFFTKLREHTGDQEYRFLWLTSLAAQKQLDIVCLEARRFCSRPPVE